MREAVDPWAPPASPDAKRSWGPLTEGLTVPRDLDLGDRTRALEQLGVKPLAHATIVGLVKDVLPETQVGLLVGSRPWPLLAARMNQIRDQHGPALLAAPPARLQTDTSWKCRYGRGRCRSESHRRPAGRGRCRAGGRRRHCGRGRATPRPGPGGSSGS
ncbi:hypothetical protein [Streptomyces erythrochromogenes]|uniref:hypothetical protein n=1 Tax=Streptomyces erythrochromogenes TaxID=285574 RepID=UPI0037D86DFB